MHACISPLLVASASSPTQPLQAAKLCPSDPLVANELGVLAYRSRQYEAAATWLQRALSLVPGGRPTPGARLLAALLPLPAAGCRLHAWRWESYFQQTWHDKQLRCTQPRLLPTAGWEATLVNLGHTLRKLRRWDAAVECYHQALGLKPGQVRRAGWGALGGFFCRLLSGA